MYTARWLCVTSVAPYFNEIQDHCGGLIIARAVRCCNWSSPRAGQWNEADPKHHELMQALKDDAAAHPQELDPKMVGNKMQTGFEADPIANLLGVGVMPGRRELGVDSCRGIELSLHRRRTLRPHRKDVANATFSF